MSSTLARSAPPPAGHNSAHLSLTEQLDPTILIAQWELDHAVMLRKRDDDVALITDMDREMRATVRAAAVAHTPAKAPFLGAGRAADAFFVSAFQGLAEKAKTLMALGTAYKVREATRLQREAQEQAARKRVEAERAIEESRQAEEAARRTAHPDVIETALAALDDATAAGAVATQAERAAAAPAADFSRTRTDRGAVSSLTSVWKFEVLDLSAVPREWLVLDDSRVALSIRRKDSPIREIPGLRIYDDKQLRGR